MRTNRALASALAMLPVLAVLAPPSGLLAQGAENCPEQTQMGLDACAGAAFKAADGRLNEVYRTVTGRLKDDASARALLVAAQRAWIGFRDAECAFRTSPTAQGSIHSMLVTQCRTELTERRAAELKAMLECEEGDLSCPVPPTP